MRSSTCRRACHRAASFAWILLAVPVSGLFAADLQKVTVSLSSGTVSAPVPFDEPFVLAGSVGSQVQRLTMTYQEDPALCGHKGQAGPPAPEQEWARRTADGNDFQFVVEPLKPHSCYSFHFVQQLAPAGESDRKELQAQLAEMVRTRMVAVAKNRSGVENVDLDRLQRDLNDARAAFVREHFHASVPDRIDLTNDKAARNAVLLVFDAQKRADEAAANVAALRGDVMREMCAAGCDKSETSPPPLTLDDWKEFRQTLQQVMDKPALLSEGSKVAWDESVVGARVRDLAAIVQAVTADPAALRGLLDGTLKISGPALVASASVDVPSIDQIGAFFMLSTTLTRAPAAPGGGSPFVFSDRYRQRCLSALVDDLRRLVARLREREAAENDVRTSTFPDLLAHRLLTQTFTVTTSPTVITEGKNPYISLDLGVGYSTRLSKGFVYYGANFYFTPVNKKAPLDQFHGGQRLLKTTSVLVGLTTAGFEDTRVKNLFGAGSPILGVGYRFNQFVKVNGGIVVFKLLSTNPLVKTDTKTVSGFGSISIDLDLKTLLGNVGNLFG